MTVDHIAETLIEEPDADALPTPDVSVIIPAFNVWPWITECLRSILREDRVPLEVIVVDDGSIDNTASLVAEVAQKDHRVRLIRSHGIGGGQARNIGAQVARGKYLMFCDADDLVAPDGIVRMHQAAELSRADMVVGDFLKFSASQTWSTTARWDLFVDRREKVTLSEVPTLIRNRACWNRLFSRSFWEGEAIRFPTVPRSNDIVPMTIALTQARRITIIPEIVYLYRQRPGTGSMTARATSIVGTLSYLGQEKICRALVASLNDEALNAVYWGMLLDSDAWMQATRYLEHLGASGALAPEVEAAIHSIVTERRERSWARVHAERQAVYSLIGAGHSCDAARLWSDFRSRNGECNPDFIDRQVRVIDDLISLGDVTPQAIDELYTQLVLLPLERLARQAETSRLITRARERVGRWGVSVRLREPSQALLRVHSALTNGDPDVARRDAAEATVGSPTVEAIASSTRAVSLTLAPPRDSQVVAAEVRGQAGVKDVSLHLSASGAPVITVADSEVDIEGTWHVWAKIEQHGIQTWREVQLENERLVPVPRTLDRFVVRWPTTRQRLVVWRRPALRSRIGGRVRRLVRRV